MSNNKLAEYGQSNTQFYSDSILGKNPFTAQPDVPVQIPGTGPINTDWGANGRIFFELRKPVPGYELYLNSTKPQSFYENTLNYSQEESPLSNAYFSMENVDSLQRDIRNMVYEICERDTDPILARHKPVRIGRQNDLQLQIIMRSIYLQYAKNLSYNIAEQIRELNDLVIKASIPDIITNLKQYIGYSADIQKLPVPMDLPQYPSSKGEKTYSLLIV